MRGEPRHYDARMTSPLSRPGRPHRVRDAGVEWRRAAVSACIGFVALVAVGAVLVAAAKLQFTSLGTGSNPLRVLSAAVMAGLTTLGAGLRIGAIQAGVVPLGALLVTGCLLAWAARTQHDDETSDDLPRDLDVRENALGAVRFGVVFGGLCALAALVFRIPEEPIPVSVSPVMAGVLGALWATAFGLLGTLAGAAPLRSSLAHASGLIRRRERGLMSQAVVFSGVSLSILMLLSLGAVLLGIIFRLVTSPLPGRLDAGDAAAGLLYLAAFLPNVLVGVASLGMGAPIEVGAEITAAGRRVGPVSEYSLAEWGSGAPPPVAFGLLLIPLLAFLVAGFAARATTAQRDRFPSELVLGAALTALLLGLLCIVADARLGGGLVSGNGVVRVAPDWIQVVPRAFGWGVAAGLAGWAAHDLRGRRKRWG